MLASKMTTAIVSGIVGVLASATISTCFAELTATPMKLQAEIEPGSAGTQSVVLTNTGPWLMIVRASLVDSKFGSHGTEETVVPGEEPRSCAGWVSLRDSEFEIEPGDSYSIELGITVPFGAAGSFWSMLLLEQATPNPPASHSNEGSRHDVYRVQRLGVRLLVDVAGTQIRYAQLESVDTSLDGDGNGSVRLRVRNVGNSVLRCDGRVEIREDGGGFSESLDLGPFVLLPESVRELDVTSGPLPSDRLLTAMTQIDFGSNQPLTSETRFPQPKTAPRFSVQVFATPSRSSADSFAEGIQEFVDDELYVDHDGQYYKVRVGRLFSMDDAKSVLRGIKQLGYYEAFLVRLGASS